MSAEDVVRTLARGGAPAPVVLLDGSSQPPLPAAAFRALRAAGLRPGSALPEHIASPRALVAAAPCCSSGDASDPRIRPGKTSPAASSSRFTEVLVRLLEQPGARLSDLPPLLLEFVGGGSSVKVRA